MLFQKDARKLMEFEALHLTGLLARCRETEAARETELDHDLLWCLIDAGEYCDTWGALTLALNCYRPAREMVVKTVGRRGSIQTAGSQCQL